MDELHSIIERLAASPPERACALATLVHVDGSSYRGVGARALALPDGDTIGLISGGCLEGDLLERAGEVLADGRARTVRYDSNAPEDAWLGLGLGCNGVVDVLLERVQTTDAASAGRYLPLLEQARCGGRRSALATVYRSPEAGEVGARLALVEEPPVAGAPAGARAGASAAGAPAAGAPAAGASAAGAPAAGAPAGGCSGSGCSGSGGCSGCSGSGAPAAGAAAGAPTAGAPATHAPAADAPAADASAGGVPAAGAPAPPEPRLHHFGHLRGALREALSRDLSALLDGGRSHSATYQVEGAPVQVLLELVEPPLALTVCGAGPDAEPLVTLAANLGWAPVVFDHRAAFARPERFPGASRVVTGAREEFAAAVPPRAGEIAVLMTHSYPTDLAYLEQLAPRHLRYIGVLGPRRRLQRLLDELGDRAPAAAALYGPAGLDIGADTPAEIALSIVAEIRAVLAGRGGAPLRDRAEPIHGATCTAADGGSGTGRGEVSAAGS